VSRLGIVAILALGVAGCGGDERMASDGNPKVAGRWYSAQQVEQGRRLYDRVCASCHGASAVGDPDWRQRDDEGMFPPPPLNGTAHAWHHPLPELRQTILQGSPAGVGRMPAWKDQIDDDQATAIIAYFSSLWPERVYQAWVKMSARRGGSS
jgi:mono/diheme cytochrome c family protein